MLFRSPNPIMCELWGTWTQDGYVTYSYPVMLQVGSQDNMFGGAMQKYGLQSLYLGSARVTDFSKIDNSLDTYGSPPYGSAATQLLAAGEKFVVWGSLDSESPQRGRSYTGKGRLLRQNRNSLDQKIYVSDVYGVPVPVAVGDSFRYVMGWGAITR